MIIEIVLVAGTLIAISWTARANLRRAHRREIEHRMGAVLYENTVKGLDAFLIQYGEYITEKQRKAIVDRRNDILAEKISTSR